ncbi:hypothetical protein GCK32_002377 [Trichostrongylus colubriformis]|uniref:Uncharacterized protein n=1 Tax=Trichostrongylus colubriformis TaxID=6319 RepID=A0AAN8IIE7_TRICO
MELVTDLLAHAHCHINKTLRSVDPLLLTSATVASTFALVQLWNMHRDDIGIKRRLLAQFFSLVKRIPWVEAKIELEIRKVKQSLHHTLHEHDGELPFLNRIPMNAVDANALIELVDKYSKLEGPRYLDGKVSGAVFNDEKDMEEMRVYVEVFKNFAWSNPLWPKLFPGVRKMEAEVVHMCCTLMHADAEGCGTMSTGGTTSILLACLSHRNRALKRGILFPEM